MMACRLVRCGSSVYVQKKSSAPSFEDFVLKCGASFGAACRTAPVSVTVVVRPELDISRRATEGVYLLYAGNMLHLWGGLWSSMTMHTRVIDNICLLISECVSTPGSSKDCSQIMLKGFKEYEWVLAWSEAVAIRN